MEKMKLINCYGILCSQMEEMALMKHISNNGIAMNTMEAHERIDFVLNFITEFNKRA